VPCATARLWEQGWFTAQPGCDPEDMDRLGQSGWEWLLGTDSGSGHKNLWLEPSQSFTHIATATSKRVFKMSKEKATRK